MRRLDLFPRIGMLFRNIFTVKVTVHNPFVNSQRDDTFSLALHSRHTVVGDDGSFLQDEIKCLQKLLPKHPSYETCVVYLMSDRPTTVRMLTEWLQEHNCTGVSVTSPSDDHDTFSLSQPISFKDEHGPNPGIGFIQDLDLSSNARSGLIGDTERSSFMLLAELVAYDRRVDDWKRGKPNAPRDKELLLYCKLPGRYGTGYNYGPGTPTFRASHHREPLEPIQVLNQYKLWHSVDALSSNDTSRLFAITYVPCPLDDATNGLHAFLNGTNVFVTASMHRYVLKVPLTDSCFSCSDLLLAIATNRTLLWKYAYDERCQESPRQGCESTRSSLNIECDRFLRMKRWLPSYQDWVDKLGLLEEPPLYLSDVASQQLSNKSRIVVFPYNWKNISKYSLSAYKLTQREDFSVDETSLLSMLYREGIDFLYGLLFEESFLFRDKVRQAADTKPLSNPLAFTIAMHSSSSKNDVDVSGSHDNAALGCLKKIMFNVTAPCQIFLVDGKQENEFSAPTTISNCSVHSLDDSVDNSIVSYQNGHGNNDILHFSSNLRFLQGMVFASDRARSDFVGPTNSKSALVRERIEYLRRQEAWKLGRIPAVLPHFWTCPTPL
jgi:hypothetical protein